MDDSFVSRLRFCSVFFAVFCPGFMIWMAPTAIKQIDSYSWPSVPGTVTGTVAKPWQDGNEVKFYGRVVCQYSVNGTQLTSDKTDLGPGEKRSEPETALADVRQYRKGDKVTVYYDPSDPAVGIIENGIPAIHMYLLIGLLIISLISIPVAFFVVRSWLRPYLTPSVIVKQSGSSGAKPSDVKPNSNTD